MIEDKKVVKIHFTLKNSEGKELETTIGEEAFEYIHGQMEILPALEAELTGKKVGDKLTVTIPPIDAYGERNEDLVEAVDKAEFKDFPGELEEGMPIEMEVEEGIIPVYVAKIDEKTVTIDMNHPLAGMTLIFDVEIIDLRDASEEELEHGYVLGDE